MAFTTVNTPLLEPFNTTFIGMGRNRLINGDMRISQVNGDVQSAGTAGTTVFGPDMFDAFGANSGGVLKVRRLADTPPTGSKYYFRTEVTTADATIAAGDQSYARTYIEGYNVVDWLSGTAGAKTVTLSFYARCSQTGTFSVGFKNENSDRGYATTYTISAANTWERKTVTLTLDTTGTWETGNLRGIQILWEIGSGTNFQATANTWTAGNKYTVAGTTQLLLTVNAFLDLALVQFELGSAATNFEYRPFQIELAMCQRYFEKSYDLDTAVGTNSTADAHWLIGTQVGATTVRVYDTFKVKKRASPTVTPYQDNATNTTGSWRFTTTAGAGNTRAVTVTHAATDGFVAEQTSALEYAALTQWIADARL